MSIIFNKTVEFGQVDHALPLGEYVKDLPQLYRADLGFALAQNKTDLWRDILQVITSNLSEDLDRADKFKYISIDSRSHMLMQGWYPCIPGWHCDDFYRPNGQPDLLNVTTFAEQRHHMIVLGDCSLTEFMTSRMGYRSAPEDQNVYGFWNSYINKKSKTQKNSFESKTVKHGQLVSFGPTDFHRGMPATKSGWRMFIRLTESNHRQPKNEIRNQTQVYLPSVGNGW